MSKIVADEKAITLYGDDGKWLLNVAVQLPQEVIGALLRYGQQLTNTEKAELGTIAA